MDGSIEMRFNNVKNSSEKNLINNPQIFSQNIPQETHKTNHKMRQSGNTHKREYSNSLKIKQFTTNYSK